MTDTNRSPRERLGLFGAWGAIPATAALLLSLNEGTTFFNDELNWLFSGSDYRPSTLLAPHNGHLIALPRILYETLPRIFGPTHLPFSIVLVSSVSLCGGLFFTFARRRVGGLAALPLTILLVLLGSAWNVILYPIGIPFVLSIALGFASLLAVERNEAVWDLIAFALLFLAIASHSFGLIFGAGLATYVLLQPRGLRRAWIFLVPGALYAGWWLWALKFGQGIAEASNIFGVPLYAGESLAAITASLTGLNALPGGPAQGSGPPTFNWYAGYLLGPLALIAFMVRIRRLRLEPWLITLLVLLVSFWVTLGLTASEIRSPTTSRYMFPGALIVLLLATEMARGVELGRRALAGLSVVAAIGIAGNAVHIRDARRFMTSYTADARTQLAMLELAGRRGNPRLRPRDAAPFGNEYLPIAASAYLDGLPTVGSLGYETDEISEQPEPVRERADWILARSYGLRAVPVAEFSAGGGCQRHGRLGLEGVAKFPLDTGERVFMRAAGSLPEALTIGRFAAAATAPAATLLPGEWAVLEVPADRAQRDWFGEAHGPVVTCERAGEVTRG